MLFQVCRELRRQQIVIKSNLVLKGDLDTWLHQKKTWKVSPYNAIRGRLLSDLCASRRLVERDMDYAPNSVTVMEVNNDLLVWLTVGGAALGELLKCNFQTWLKYIKTTHADAYLQVAPDSLTCFIRVLAAAIDFTLKVHGEDTVMQGRRGNRALNLSRRSAKGASSIHLRSHSCIRSCTVSP